MEEKTNVEEEVLSDDNPQEDDIGTDEEESGEEPEVETGGDLSSDDGGDEDDGGETDDRQARKDRAKAQIERLKEENKRLKEEKRKAERGQVDGKGTDMMAKAYLAATFDIKESDAQEEALRLADKFEMSVDELMEDADYRERITNLQKRIVQTRKVSANTGGAAQRKKDAAYYADYFKKNQSFPEGLSLEMKDQALDHLSGKQKQAWQ